MPRCLPDTHFSDFPEIEGGGHELDGSGPLITREVLFCPTKNSEPEGDGLTRELDDEDGLLMGEPEEEHGIRRMGFEILTPEMAGHGAEVLHEAAVHGMTEQRPGLKRAGLPEQRGGEGVGAFLGELSFEMEIHGGVEVWRDRWDRGSSGVE